MWVSHYRRRKVNAPGIGYLPEIHCFHGCVLWMRHFRLKVGGWQWWQLHLPSWGLVRMVEVEGGRCWMATTRNLHRWWRRLHVPTGGEETAAAWRHRP